MAFIKAISYYLPDKIVTNEQLVEEFPEWSVDKIAQKVGICERHVAAENETAGDMAIKAACRLFEEHAIERNCIDFLILCTQSPDYYLPSTSCVIQYQLGLNTSCGAFDINLGCSGYEYGLAVAKGLVDTHIASHVLLLTSETYTKHIHPKDKGNRTIFGDAATATLIANDGFAEIGEFCLGTDGSGAGKLIHKTGGMRHPKHANDLTIDENNIPISSDYLFMDGNGIFDFTADTVPVLVENTLKKHHLSMEDISLFVFHQANKYMINYLRKVLEIDKEKFYVYMEHVGNTVSSTIPIAMYHAKKEGRLKGHVLLAGFGVGLSYGATILHCDE